MLGISSNRLNLPRRVVVYYAVACIAGFTSFLTGLVIVFWQGNCHSVENACLAHLERSVVAAELRVLRDELDSVELRPAQNGAFLYGAIVSAEGRYLAHTDASLIGERVIEPTASPIDGIDVPGVVGLRYESKDGFYVREYRKPMKQLAGKSGHMRLAIREPTLWQSVQPWTPSAPFVVIVPMTVVLIGSLVLRRTVQPLALVERQLSSVAILPELASANLETVNPSGAVSLGWNRLLDYLVELRQQRPLDELIRQQRSSCQSSDLDRVISSLSEGIAVTEGLDVIRVCNSPFCSSLASSVKPEDLIGKSIQALFANDEDQNAWGQLSDPTAAKRTVIAEIEKQDGPANRFLRFARHPMAIDDAGAGYVWTVRDVTQQKLADRMRDQFLDSATHELRTPLANIKAFAETLAVCDMTDIDQQKEFCNTIDTEATRLARFIDDLLDISSLEAGSLTIHRTNTELARLLTDLIDKIKPLMDQKNIEFEVHLPEKLPEVVIDKDKIATSLVNLLGNASKYTPSGGKVDFRVNSENDWLQFEIEDKGVGIAEDDLPRIFDKFFRSNDPRVRRETGTGIGLSLAKQVFELHGGSLSVASAINQGSLFTARLPIVAAQFQEA